MIRGTLQTAALCAVLVGCGDGGAAPPGGTTADAERAGSPSRVAAAARSSSFRAAMSGDVELSLEGGAVAGARYDRYHINLASDANAGQPIVVIAFGRDDTSTPAPGRFALGGSEADFPDGHVEIYGDPQREFTITTGELKIISAAGDVLTGEFSLTAREPPEDYGGPSAEIRVEGTFRTQPAD
jgi:hypothetical protein